MKFLTGSKKPFRYLFCSIQKSHTILNFSESRLVLKVFREPAITCSFTGESRPMRDKEGRIRNSGAASRKPLELVSVFKRAKQKLIFMYQRPGKKV
jgi:hypothetical protein